jgi:glycosyltransferase involved in cell wall biosynthesis
MKLSVIIPCYNEAENIPLILAEYGKLVASDDLEIILVNNGSTDNSASVLAELAPKYPFLKVVTVPVNQGYGFGILSGLRSAQSEYIGWTHGDMQTPPKDVLRALGIINANSGQTDLYLKGTRHGRPLADNIITWGMTVFEFLCFGLWLDNINAQPNIFHRSFFERWQNPPTDFSLDLYAFYRAKKEKLKIIRFPVYFLKRIHGESNWNKNFWSKWKAIKRAMSYSLKLRNYNK